MDKIRIGGGRALTGEIHIGGAKNAALPLMAACLLSEHTLTLSNLPHLDDITTMATLLAELGVDLRMNGDQPSGCCHGRTLELSARTLSGTVAPYDLVRKMRASVLVLGPLLARAGEAEVSLPGGCAIGSRPVDLHLAALADMGAEIELEGGYVRARAPNGLVGARVVFPKVSVGATENLLMAATLARGETTLVNAAREPEIGDLARCLIAMGADIEGLGSDTLVIQGRAALGAASHAVIPDRIEAGTYAMAAGITDGDLELVNAQVETMDAPLRVLEAAGMEVRPTNRGIRVRRVNGPLKGVDVTTEPYPGFPTDLQAQLTALMTSATSTSTITEAIFENRFMHIPELSRMGADITTNHSTAVVRGGHKLVGAPVMATDLRASVSLVLAGLAAEGETVVSRVYHLDRGYEHLEEKLRACGADIERLTE